MSTDTLHELTEKPMNWRSWLLVLAALLQLVMLAGVYLGAKYPLWTGEPVTLRVVPVDPRDLFRGNYARLNYGISSLPASLLPDQDTLREGQRVYVTLAPGEDGFWQATALSTQRPEHGTVVRGRVQWASGGQYVLRYGIEAWFAPKEKALALEDTLRGGGAARVMLAANGKAALVAVGERPSEFVDEQQQ
ncbi:hypothetical protein A167_02755 [Alcanivorax sp. S71-1-4]|jgi:uncharacterized membrane-anchored protein|uniref:GDYXXLXY domain-containing protein n=1 Tax=Alcanivorax sp. S71-1-4 TaxID=1177159 RepID=UPI0016BB95BE|nr:GDYXXLXY domain-containing protein [Alcanivorax sp. S71-1-4]KAF0807881.1 hypothetical protein A167_02755 [Alcanivorax sp. S71-1-4]